MNVEQIEAPLSNPVRSSYLEPRQGVSRPWNFCAALILLSAFLLFQTELILAKYILPWFGGTPSVWNTCMLFYQTVLLAGYGYSHWLCSHQDGRKQARTHMAIVVIALAALALTVILWGSPLTPAAHWKYWLNNSPVLHIVLLLTIAVGIPFLLLSATSPLMQYWYSQLFPHRSPYRLYAISNLGSLLGLLGYPFLLEWLLPIRTQALVWTVLFASFLGLSAAQNWMVSKAAPASIDTEPRGVPCIKVLQFALWSSLSACASVMLLATTNLVCQDISSNPFLWVVPLCLYLLSFTICFENGRWYRRPIFFTFYIAGVCLTARMLASPRGDLDAISQLSTYFLLLFAVSMVSNGELERLKPAPERLTPFYLSIGLGGALGGVFVVLIAPYLFQDFYEFHLAVLVAGLLILTVSLLGWRRSRRTKLGVRRRYETSGWIVSVLATVAVLLLLGSTIRMNVVREAGNVVERRNFFGRKRVYDKEGVRYLQHGAITHGGQILSESAQMEPITYYSPSTGVGLLLQNYRSLTGRSESAPLRLGVIGLGAGTLAAWTKPGDYMRFYEIDPQVVELSEGPHPVFTYLKKSQGRIDTVLGDARMNLEAEAEHHELQQFDVLIVDAFGGDAIPIHLLTSEAIEVYLEHLRGPDSVIAVNISNRVLDLTPVLRALSSKRHLTFDHVALNDIGWVLLSRNEKLLKSDVLYRSFGNWSTDTPVLWTDDYSNLLSVLKR